MLQVSLSKHDTDTFDKFLQELEDIPEVINAFLVTGNLKHYPSEHFIITPAQMIELLNTSEEVGWQTHFNRLR